MMPEVLMAHSPVLFTSADSAAVCEDPVNEEWLAVVNNICGELFEGIERRYYVALHFFRRQLRRPKFEGLIEVEAEGKQLALQGMLDVLEQRKVERKQAASQGDTSGVLFDARPDPGDDNLPKVLRDFSEPPPSLAQTLSGPGRPPCDALCLMRAFLAAPLMRTTDDPTSVHHLLHSNPTFARACGFLGKDAMKQASEPTSRRLPSLSVCEEFNEIMTRYGLWHLARMDQVTANMSSGAVEVEDTVVFDTTHIEANSHCDNVVPLDAETGKNGKPKHRKVPRMRKFCSCGEQNWETCPHQWSPTDQGAAVVVKGPTRIYWAHKASVAAFGDSEIPFDARVCWYGAEGDGKTLMPHLHLLKRDLPTVSSQLRHVIADDPYRENLDAVVLFSEHARLTVPVRCRRVNPSLAKAFHGIDRFTPTGVPVCEGGFRFELLGRDLSPERYIWVAPDDDANQPVCLSCPLAETCLSKGSRRYIRVNRQNLPQIDWDYPQHSAKNRARYNKRTGVERAIKRLKVDLNGEHLTHRNVNRVQAHLDRRLLTIHILLAAQLSP
jgi:hypothetical protein